MRIAVYGNRILFGVSVVLVPVTLIYLMLNLLFGHGSSHPIYWLVFASNADDLMASLLCGSVSIIWSVFAAFAILFYRFKGAKHYARLGAKSLLATLIAIAFMFGSYLARFWQSGVFAHRETVESVTLNNHPYHLLLYGGDWAEQSSRYYYLYECDGFDVFCTEITLIPQSNGGISPDVQKIRLVADATANEISIEVNGISVLTHQSK